MSKRFPPMRYPLPNPVEPGSTICFTIVLPNAAEYISAVKGAIYALASAHSWADDPAHFALDTADRMWTAFNTIKTFDEDCSQWPLPNWYLSLDMIQGDFYRSAWYSPARVLFEDGAVGEVYNLAAWATGAPSELRFDIIGRDRETSSPVGGYFNGIDISSQTDPAGQGFHEQVETCEGTTPGGDFTTPISVGPGNYRTYSLVSGAQEVFMVTLVTKGDWTCTP